MRRLAAFIVTALLLTAHSAYAAREANWIGFPALSPDGSILIFSAWGDIWAAPVDGSHMARRLTDNVAYDGWPVVSPDGQQIAFISDRFGNYDIFVMPALGGQATRLTYGSGEDYLYDWKPDGTAVLSYATHNRDQWAESMYEVPLSGGEPRRISGPDHENHRYCRYLGDGQSIVYTRGPGDWAQKNYRGAMNYDLWSYDAQTGEHRQLTSWEGNDTWPQPTPDGSRVYFVRNADGCDSIYALDMATGEATASFCFSGDGARWPRISADGSRLAFTVSGEPFVMDLPDGRPQRVRIVFDGDPKKETQLSMDRSGDIAEYALSPNGKYFAFINMGDVYVLKNPDSYKEGEKPDQDLSRAFRLTNTAGREMQIAWHPKNGKVAYISDRDGQYDVYAMDLATREETRITISDADEWYPSFAPVGDKLAYYSGNRQLIVDDLAAKTQVAIAEGRLRSGPFALGYEWSPDAQWIAYSVSVLDYLPDIFVANVATREAVNVSFSPDWDSGVTWSKDGKYLAWTQEDETSGEVVLLELSPKEQKFDTDILFPDDKPKDEPAPDSEAGKTAPEDEGKADESAGDDDADDAKDEGESKDKQDEPEVKPVKIDFDRIHLRAEAITHMQGSAGNPLFDPSSKYILFNSDHGGESEWWTVTIEGHDYSRVASADRRGYAFWTPDGGKLYSLNHGNIGYANMSGASPGSGGGSVPTTARIDFNQHAVWDQMLLEGWRALRDGFYDSAMHGVDWNDVLRRYRPRVQELGAPYEFEQLMREMLGELNASHLGFGSASTTVEAPADVTCDLGVDYDEAWGGAGWRVWRVVPRGPADQPGSKLYGGDVILSVNGKAVDAALSRAQALNNLQGQPVVLTVQSGAVALEAISSNISGGDGPSPSGADEERRPAAAATEADSGAALPPGQRRVVIGGVPEGAVGGLRYEMWVEDNRAKTTELSDGKIAYQHIASMNGPSLEKFRRELFTESRGKQALIIDVRFNGGGNIHEQLVDILDRRPFGIASFRDDQRVVHPALRWDGPIVVLINTNSFSDAEIFPHIMQRLGLATVIGEPTGGNVIGTYNFDLLDGSTFRLPNRGWWLLDDTNLEGNGAQPDVHVVIDPGAIAQGEDNQLAAAVEVLQKTLGSET